MTNEQKYKRRNFIVKTVSALSIASYFPRIIFAAQRNKTWREVDLMNWIIRYKKGGKFKDGVDWGVTREGEFYVDNKLETNNQKIAQKFFDNVITFRGNSPDSSTFTIYGYKELSFLEVNFKGDIWIKNEYVGVFERKFDPNYKKNQSYFCIATDEEFSRLYS